MKLPFLLAVVLFATHLSAENPIGSVARPIDDRAVRLMFEQRLTEMKKEEQTVSPATLLSQLKERRRISEKIVLPRVDADAETDETNQYRKAKAASVVFGKLYLCGKCDKWHPSLAGGVILSPDGLVVTNHHVLEGDNLAFGGMTPDGSIYPVEEILVSSKKRDVALVKLTVPEGTTLPYVELGEDAEIGEDIFVVSHPEGRFYSFTEGVVSRYYQDRSKAKSSVFMQITADFARGSSGSGVFDAEGRLVGLVVSTNSIYYGEKDGIETDLQMVVKSTAPVSAIRDLLGTAE